MLHIAREFKTENFFFHKINEHLRTLLKRLLHRLSQLRLFCFWSRHILFYTRKSSEWTAQQKSKRYLVWLALVCACITSIRSQRRRQTGKITANWNNWMGDGARGGTGMRKNRILFSTHTTHYRSPLIILPRHRQLETDHAWTDCSEPRWLVVICCIERTSCRFWERRPIRSSMFCHCLFLIAINFLEYKNAK